MLRINRSRLIGMLCLGVILYFLIFTDSGSSGSEFRANTEAGLSRKQQREQELPLRGHLSDEDLTKKTNEELQSILSGQSKETVEKDPDGNPVGRVHRDWESVRDKEGYAREEPKTQKEMVSPESTNPPRTIPKPKYPKTGEKDEVESASDPGKDFAREKLLEYLKNPVVIFSKSYCPHSKRAKHLLLELYKIEPKPLVVELDTLGERIPSADPTHETHGKITLGQALQDLLAEITGRRTVPNIVVGAHHSIGGNDIIWGLHESGSLVEELKKFGGRKIVSVDVVEQD